MNHRIPKPALLVGVLLALQGSAALLYHWVEREKSADLSTPLDCQQLAEPQRAPELELERSDRSRLRLSDFLGQWVLVHFWATWCPPCREEFPGLLKLKGKPTPAGRLELVAVAVEEPWEAIHPFFGGKTPTEVVRDWASDGHRRYAVSTLPVTLLVTPEGQIILRCTGAQEWPSTAAQELLSNAIFR